MKIIILAAGMGTRLGADGIPPKALSILLDGQSILEHQLDNISRFLKLSDVRVVVGYQAEKIKERFPQLAYVHNHQYMSENTSQSLRKALEEVEGEDVLWLNGDVVFHHSALAKLLTQRRNSVLVNTSLVGEEEVKYQTDEFGRVLEISKGVSDPIGEALGINFFTAYDLHLLKEALAECEVEYYFEHAIQACIDAGVDVWAVEVDPTRCVEVDFPDDLERANRLIKEWQKEETPPS